MLDRKKQIENRKKLIDEAYEAAQRDILDDNKDVKAFKEGYKLGFKDGYQAAAEDGMKMGLLNIPPEIREKMGEGAQPGWPPRWW